MNQTTYGRLTAPAFGILMKDMALRAMRKIREMRFSSNPREKVNPDKKFDLITDADIAAQSIYIKLIRECFPDFGIIAEENGFRGKPRNGCDIWVTVDPLDGTKAYGRLQSHGVGTMIAFVQGNTVIAAAVGDITSGELYYFRPESNKVHRLDITAGLHHELEAPAEPTGYLLLEDPLESYQTSPETLRRIDDVFKGHQIAGGSIGVRFTRLWNGELSAIMLKATKSQPWDFAPTYGISAALGYRFYYVTSKCRELKPVRVNHEMLTSPWVPNREMLVIHEFHHGLLPL